MERRIVKKVEQHQLDFKSAIKTFLEENKCQVKSTSDANINNSGFLKFIYDFENLTLLKDDFKKRKRIKNQVPQYERCEARRANCEQCTRRKKDTCSFCGTHSKGTPHGVVDSAGDEVKKVTKIEVWVKEIKGINYYVDTDYNVYLPGDILSNVPNPRKIGKCEMSACGAFHIPNLEY
jgi:hypothetical protein